MRPLPQPSASYLYTARNKGDITHFLQDGVAKLNLVGTQQIDQSGNEPISGLAIETNTDPNAAPYLGHPGMYPYVSGSRALWNLFSVGLGGTFTDAQGALPSLDNGTAPAMIMAGPANDSAPATVGTIEYYPLGLALVINQTPSVPAEDPYAKYVREAFSQNPILPPPAPVSPSRFPDPFAIGGDCFRCHPHPKDLPRFYSDPNDAYLSSYVSAAVVRGTGILRMAAGMVAVPVAVAMTATPLAPLVPLLGFWCADQINTGSKQAWENIPQESAGHKAITAIAGKGFWAEFVADGYDILPGAAAGASKLFSKQGALIEPITPVVAPLTGQIHHPISTRIGRALGNHPTLRGCYKPRDPRFTTQAVDEAAHRGYQTWHRQLDDEVAGWLRAEVNQAATPVQFEAWLRQRYAQPDLLARFPNGF